MTNNPASFRMFLANCTGNAQNTIYRTPVTITNAEDLAAACRKDHVCVAFEECRRKNENFIRGYALAADCDNDFTDDPSEWITPETVAVQLPGVAFYAVKSRNCDKVKHPGESNEKSARPRWHYYFPLRVPVEGFTAAKKLFDMFQALFPMFDDDGTKPAQFFYGHAEPIAEYFPGETDIIEYFRENPIEIEPEPAVDTEPAVRTVAPVSDDFAALNVHDLLSHISASCDYGTWYKVGMAIKSAGLPFELWDDWSRSAPDLYPGAEKMRRKWLSFKGGRITFGTLVHMATENGWKADPDKLTGEAKANHEAAEAHKEEVRRFREEHREEYQAALAKIGIVTDDPYRYTCTYDFDGSIVTVTEKESRDIVYKRPAAEVIQGITVRQAVQIKPNKPEKKPLELTNYDNVEIKETDYLFFPWIPRGKLTAIQGDSGSSKSTFMYAVGALVSTGADLLGVPCGDPGNVLFITNEDDASDILTAFQDAGGDTSHLLRIADREQIAMIDLSPGGAADIEKIIKDHDIKLLVLDPIQAFLRGDMNKANETRPQLARLMDIAAANNCAIVFIEHMGKDTSKAALHRGVGSVDIAAATRSIIQIVTDPEDDYCKIAFTVKNNTADHHEVRKAIRYQVRDHPGSIDPATKKHRHFHGHAEFVSIIPDYSERSYKRAQRNAEESSLKAEIDYETDPLVVTVRELMKYNPEGIFIGAEELIRRITIFAGHCPYTQTQSKQNGLNSRISALRSMMMENDSIQMDIKRDPTTVRAYRWEGEVINPENPKERGVYLTPINNGSGGSQQTEI